MGTVKQLIEDALGELVVLSEGEEASDTQINVGLRYLTNMIAMWSIEGLMVPYQTTETFTLDSSYATYNWATGQSAPHFNSASPVRIKAASFAIGNYQKPLKIVDKAELLRTPIFGNIAEPSLICFDRQTIPTISFDCAPYGGVVKIISEKPLDNTLTLTETLAFPDYCNLPLMYNLAVLLCGQYEIDIDTTLALNARTNKGILERFNMAPVPTLRSPIPNNRRASGRGLLVR
jgi:hypothetical protein